MGTEVLRPQDCLIERLRIHPHTAVSRKTFNYGPPPPPPPKPHRKQQQSVRTRSKRSHSSDDVTSFIKNNNNRNHGTGNITILRRGESFESKIRCHVSKQQGGGSAASESDLSHMYAGSAFYTSPSPSSLPLPSFSQKKKEMLPMVDDSATRDLRRLLRLD